MKEKTAMQKLIEKIESIKKGDNIKLHELFFFDGILAIVEQGGYLEKEREQIEEAYRDRATSLILTKDYYNSKYGGEDDRR